MISKIVETNKGLIEGIEEERGYRFLGVPFVKAPIGDLSFKRPQEVEKWSGIYKADKPKANPIQREGTFSVGYNNQDSLYLNIYVPKIAKEKEKIPVMVWIYGGSYATGGTGLKNDKTLQIEYDSSDFANDTGCIIVNFNYRLNIYGYLNLHSISDDFDLNNGIYDQMAALKFIKENIASFGGDENNITLFGQSAGGSSIIALMSIPEISNLFHKAIVMSPVSEHFFFPKESKKLAKKYLSYLKINKKNLDKLYSLTPQEIKDANKKLADYAYRKGELRCPFSPTIDGVLLKDEPKKLAALNNKPLLIGNVINEGNLFLLKAPDFALPFMVKLFGLKLKKKKGDTHAPKTIVIKQGKRDIVNEAFRVLRTNLEFILDAKEEKDRASVTLITSFNPGSGKTFLTMNTAATFAMKGKRVLVVDGDLRHGSASAYVGSPKKGLSDYLGNRENNCEDLIVEKENYPGLFVLPVGTIPPNPTELLAEPRLAELLETMRGRFDYILIDCPPVDLVADTQIIEKLADRTVFIVRAGLLERDMLPQLQSDYDAKRFKNMALVLNGTIGGSSRYGYRYGYKYGYKYGYSSKGYYGN